MKTPISILQHDFACKNVKKTNVKSTLTTISHLFANKKSTTMNKMYINSPTTFTRTKPTISTTKTKSLRKHRTPYNRPDPLVDKSFEDSIQELNNLIGELDSFQREIDASKRSKAATPITTTTTTPTASTGDNCGDRPFPLISTSSSSGASIGIGDDTGSNTKATVAECGNTGGLTPLTVICAPHPLKSPQCASNQTSGCGTDLSDAASDDIPAEVDSLTSINNHNNNAGTNSGQRNPSAASSRDSCFPGTNDNNGRTLQQYNSDSELSRCYVSETSSLAGGYENPTFAHFATATSSSSIAASSGVDEPADVASVIGDSRSLMAVSSTTTADDCVSHASYNMDNYSDGGSNVVVIYDHQIPITPDIDYVKQNSEIVVLRTKDPLQQQLARQDMRELTQLPANLCAPLNGASAPGASMMSALALSSSSLSCSVPTSPPHTATVAPAKQRLSSFRASSEQQLQLLGCSENNNSGSELSLLRAPNQHTYAGTPQAQAQEDIRGGSRRVATPNAYNNSDTIIRRKAALPPKPSLSIFNGQVVNNLLESSSTRKSSSNGRGNCEAVAERLSGAPTPPPPPLLAKANFKADLDAKLRKQKLKLQLQQEQQHHQELLQQKQQLLQEQHQLQYSSRQSAANNTNSPIYLSNHSHNNNHSNQNNSNSSYNTNNTTTTTATTANGNRNSSDASRNTNNNSYNNNCNAISFNKRSCSTPIPPTKTTTATASPSNHLAFVGKAAFSSHHTTASASASASASSSAGSQLVYQNGTNSSSNNSNNSSSKSASKHTSSPSTAYTRTNKQIHSNRTHYQFHALKSQHNNTNIDHIDNIINGKSRAKRSASMKSTATRASPPSSSSSTLPLSSLSFHSASCLPSRSPTDRIKCQPTSPLPRLQSTTGASTGQHIGQKQKHHTHIETVHTLSLPSSSSPPLSSSSPSVSVSSCTYACSSACASTPPPIHTKQSAASTAVSAVSTSASNLNSNINSAVAKPNITPRPASLSGSFV